jgi:uncharacterized membrane protein
MRRLLSFLLLLVIFCTSLLTPVSFAQSVSPASYVKAKVLAVNKEGVKDIDGKKSLFQDVVISLLEGPEKGKTIQIEYGGMTAISEPQKVHAGDTVIVSTLKSQDNKTLYTIVDHYRLPSLLLISAVFIFFVLLLTGKKGIGALSGLVISLLIIVLFIIPQILSGHDPLTVSILGSLVIMVVTLYLAHGLNHRTTIAVVATFLSLVLTGLLAVLSVHIAKLSGLGSEDAVSLFVNAKTSINFQGLLLGGIIIGALGVLDDTTTTQSTTIAELSEADPSFTFKDLVARGMVIGKEHIASLVNTLVLAYAGAAISIFIFIILSLKSNSQPWWVIFNSELLAEEIVRTLAGSIGLVLAVPITTLLAALFAKYSIKIS